MRQKTPIDKGTKKAKDLGRRIGDARRKLAKNDPRWTQEYVGSILEPPVRGTEVSRWENGTMVPNAHRLGQLASLYGTTVDVLVKGIVDPKQLPGNVTRTPPARDGVALKDALQDQEARIVRHLDDAIDKQTKTLEQAIARGFDRLVREVGQARR